MAQVQIIQPYQPQSDALEKVAAYCRVSTDSKDQLNSYRTQIGYYTNFIAQHPGWELVDIYADEGITGTSLEKRDEFKRMLQDCRAGKITSDPGEVRFPVRPQHLRTHRDHARVERLGRGRCF